MLRLTGTSRAPLKGVIRFLEGDYRVPLKGFDILVAVGLEPCYSGLSVCKASLSGCGHLSKRKERLAAGQKKKLLLALQMKLYPKTRPAFNYQTHVFWGGSRQILYRTFFGTYKNHGDASQWWVLRPAYSTWKEPLTPRGPRSTPRRSGVALRGKGHLHRASRAGPSWRASGA